MEKLKKQKYKIEKNGGITLIALVITIIVLLILAAISITMITGDNSILKRATDAKTKSDEAQIRERIQLSYHSALTEGKGSYTKDSLMEELKNEFKTDYDVDDSNSQNWKMKAHGQEITIPAGIEKTPEYADNVKSELTEGKYVTYNEKTYRVLYDINSGYGWIEIISAEPLESVTLGYSDSELPSNTELESQGYGATSFEKARWSYNYVIKTLNKKAQSYITNLSNRARCVGSDPVNPDKDIIELNYEVTDSDINPYIKTKGYNNKFKTQDTNSTRGTDINVPKKDKDQLDTIDAAKFSDKSFGSRYWLSSRYIAPMQAQTIFDIFYVTNSGEQYAAMFCVVNSDGTTYNDAPTAGFRPIIRLKTEIKILGGSGTSESPYEIGI